MAREDAKKKIECNSIIHKHTNSHTPKARVGAKKINSVRSIYSES
jgi:hypothetical protein